MQCVNHYFLSNQFKNIKVGIQLLKSITHNISKKIKTGDKIFSLSIFKDTTDLKPQYLLNNDKFLSVNKLHDIII